MQNTAIDMPRRITVTQDSDDTVIRLRASALPGQILSALVIVALLGVAYLVLFINGGYAELQSTTGAPIILGIGGIILLGVVVQFAMRGFNVTTFRLTPEKLTRRTVPFALGGVSIPRDEIHGITVKSERTSEVSRDDGIRIFPYSIDVFDTNNKRRTIKGSVRGRQHSLYIALIIAQTYNLRSVEGLQERLQKTQQMNGFMRLLLD